MKPSFALYLSHDGIELFHRGKAGWTSAGVVPLDERDLPGALAVLRRTAAELEPGRLSTKIVIPDSQVLFTGLDLSGISAEEDRPTAIRRALEGRTPYPVDELVFDWRPVGGGRVQLAVIARDTLAEAETFAVEHRFNPVSFVGVAETGEFEGEPFFGAAPSAEAMLAEAGGIHPDEHPVPVGRLRRGFEADAGAEGAGPEEDPPGSAPLPEAEAEAQSAAQAVVAAPEVLSGGQAGSAADDQGLPEAGSDGAVDTAASEARIEAWIGAEPVAEAGNELVRLAGTEDGVLPDPEPVPSEAQASDLSGPQPGPEIPDAEFSASRGQDAEAAGTAPAVTDTDILSVPEASQASDLHEAAPAADDAARAIPDLAADEIPVEVAVEIGAETGADALSAEPDISDKAADAEARRISAQAALLPVTGDTDDNDNNAGIPAPAELPPPSAGDSAGSAPQEPGPASAATAATVPAEPGADPLAAETAAAPETHPEPSHPEPSPAFASRRAARTNRQAGSDSPAAVQAAQPEPDATLTPAAAQAPAPPVRATSGGAQISAREAAEAVRRQLEARNAPPVAAPAALEGADETAGLPAGDDQPEASAGEAAPPPAPMAPGLEVSAAGESAAEITDLPGGAEDGRPQLSARRAAELAAGDLRPGNPRKLPPAPPRLRAMLEGAGQRKGGPRAAPILAGPPVVRLDPERAAQRRAAAAEGRDRPIAGKRPAGTGPRAGVIASRGSSAALAPAAGIPGETPADPSAAPARPAAPGLVPPAQMPPAASPPAMTSAAASAGGKARKGAAAASGPQLSTEQDALIARAASLPASAGAARPDKAAAPLAGEQAATGNGLLARLRAAQNSRDKLLSAEAPAKAAAARGSTPAFAPIGSLPEEDRKTRPLLTVVALTLALVLAMGGFAIWSRLWSDAEANGISELARDQRAPGASLDLPAPDLPAPVDIADFDPAGFDEEAADLEGPYFDESRLLPDDPLPLDAEAGDLAGLLPEAPAVPADPEAGNALAGAGATGLPEDAAPADALAGLPQDGLAQDGLPQDGLAQEPGAGGPADTAAPEFALAAPAAGGPDTPMLPADPETELVATDSGAAERVAAQLAAELTPEIASRHYDSSGVWVYPPGTPASPRGETSEDVRIAAIDTEIDGQDAIGLESTGPDLTLLPQLPPPAAGTTFDFDENGLVRATREGALSPDGILVRLGSPAPVPPRRPGSAVPAPAAAPVEAAPVAAPADIAGAAPGAVPPEAVSPEAGAAAAPLPMTDPPPPATKPRWRPEDLTELNERANFGGRTLAEFATVRPRTRPEEILAVAVAASVTLPSADEATAAAAAAAEAANLISPTPLAVAHSPLPKSRPGNFARIVAAAVRPAAPAPAAQPAPAPGGSRVAAAPALPEDDGEPELARAMPKLPTQANVARTATITRGIRFESVNLIGVYGTPAQRRALVRLSNGRFQKVKVGDRLDGGTVQAIGDGQLIYVKGRRQYQLEMPRG